MALAFRRASAANIRFSVGTRMTLRTLRSRLVVGQLSQMACGVQVLFFLEKSPPTYVISNQFCIVFVPENHQIQKDMLGGVLA
ncbi:hypothetical protein TNCV_3600751 [Trichonephila clavipes]|nr:hypothetical protein TNCV_3600751 [Trichonephila clavipes]